VRGRGGEAVVEWRVSGGAVGSARLLRLFLFFLLLLFGGFLLSLRRGKRRGAKGRRSLRGLLVAPFLPRREQEAARRSRSTRGLFPFFALVDDSDLGRDGARGRPGAWEALTAVSRVVGVEASQCMVRGGRERGRKRKRGIERARDNG
jgi:hypothetical protein